MNHLRITGGSVYDPANAVGGEVRDICIEDGRIVASLPDSAPRLDARGMVVMPGGVDMHCHVASSSVNVARRLLPEEHARHPAIAPSLDNAAEVPRSGADGTVPTTFTTGYRYAGLGYTTVFDAAVAPIMARTAHGQLDDTPIVDGGFFALLGNDDYLLRLIDSGDRERAREYAAWVLAAVGAYAIKIVNPAGVERWKRGTKERTDLDTTLGSSRVTPRAILETLVDAANTLRLPHAAHIHCNNLGLAGNSTTTLATMVALDGRRAHFTHLQFHSYGKSPEGRWRSAAREIVEYVNTHQNISGDVGQVMFGPAATITADAPVEFLLHKSSGRKWANVDIELETGCGVVPHEYKDTNAVAALQWAIGLELFLLSSDPWRMVLSTDHQAKTTLQPEHPATSAAIDVVDAFALECLRALKIVAVVAIAAIDDNVAGLHARGQLLNGLTRHAGGNHHPGRARLGQLCDQLVKRCGALNAPSHDLLNGGGVHIVDDARVAILRHALH